MARDRPVAEEPERDLVAVLIVDGERRAGRHRRPRTDDTVRAEHPGVDVGDVHRATFTVTVAVGLAEQLGHHELGIESLGDTVAVTTVGAGDVIVGRQRGTRTDPDGLLADVEVDESRNLPVREVLARRRVELSNRQHPAQRFASSVSRIYGIACHASEANCGE